LWKLCRISVQFVHWYSFYRMYSRYSDVSTKNGTWRKIWIGDIWRNLNDVIKVISRKLEQKKNFRESNLWPHVSLITTLTLIFYARKLQIKVCKHCTTVHCAYAYHYVLLWNTRFAYFPLTFVSCASDWSKYNNLEISCSTK
jgi:hypothetical protein